MKKLLLLTLITGLAFTACKKDDDQALPNQTGSKYTADELALTNGTQKVWKLIGIHVKGITEDGQTVDADADMQDCVLDNRFIFNINRNVTSLGGDEKCDPNEESEIIQTWNFVTDSTFEWGGDTIALASLKENELKVSFETIITGGTLGNIDATLTNTYVPE